MTSPDPEPSTFMASSVDPIGYAQALADSDSGVDGTEESENL